MWEFHRTTDLVSETSESEGKWLGVGGGGGRGTCRELDYIKRDRDTTITSIRESCIEPDSDKPITERHLLGLHSG